MLAEVLRFVNAAETRFTAEKDGDVIFMWSLNRRYATKDVPPNPSVYSSTHSAGAEAYKLKGTLKRRFPTMRIEIYAKGNLVYVVIREGTPAD